MLSKIGHAGSHVNASTSEYVRHDEDPQLHLAYFDTSAWNGLVDHPKSDAIVTELQRRRVIVLASVISVGEVLKTPVRGRVERLRSLMLKLHGDGPLLERPMTLATEAARAFFRNETDFRLPQSGTGQSLLKFLSRPDDADVDSIAAWLKNLDRNHGRFLDEIRPEQPNRKTQYYSEEIAHSEPFLKLLSTVPAAQELGLSLVQVAELLTRVDIWRALAGTLGYIITQAMAHAPRQGGKRPGGPDMWQVVYLGVVEAFVSSDVRLLEAAKEISSTLRYSRCVIRTCDFLDGLAVSDMKSRCLVCGSSTRMGMHALDPRVAAAS
jgi:hypothetical protein